MPDSVSIEIKRSIDKVSISHSRVYGTTGSQKKNRIDHMHRVHWKLFRFCQLCNCLAWCQSKEKNFNFSTIEVEIRYLNKTTGTIIRKNKIIDFSRCYLFNLRKLKSATGSTIFLLIFKILNQYCFTYFNQSRELWIILSFDFKKHCFHFVFKSIFLEKNMQWLIWPRNCLVYLQIV